MPDIMVVKQGKDFTVMNKVIAICIALLTVVSCKDNTVTGSDFFTPVQVYLNINLSLPAYAALSVPQGYVYENGGNKGIIVYRTIFNEYVAFDRTCPDNPGNACSYISMDSSNAYYRCGHYAPNWQACCNSKFDPATGNVLTSPAKRALKQYYVKQDGTTLIVSNTPQ